MKPTQVVAVGPSLGSFSVSAALLLALLDEFAKELEGKTAKLDSDPDFWMPLVWRNYCPIEPLLNPTAYGHGESNRLGGTKLNGYSDETVANGTNLGVRSAHEAVSTPAKFPLQECSPYSCTRTTRTFGICPSLPFIFCRHVKPRYNSQLFHRCTPCAL